MVDNDRVYQMILTLSRILETIYGKEDRDSGLLEIEPILSELEEYGRFRIGQTVAYMQELIKIQKDINNKH